MRCRVAVVGLLYLVYKTNIVDSEEIRTVALKEQWISNPSP